MSAQTSIEWTELTWNPTTGCDRISAGCDNCYALTMAKRLKSMGSPKYQTDGDPETSGPGFGITMHDNALRIPLGRKKPTRIFVDSMSDLFHHKVSDQFIARVFAVMATTPDHTYQILTKRPARMRALLSDGELGTEGFPDMVEEAMAEFTHAGLDEWPLRNVWLGTSIENQQQANVRVRHLLETPAAVRWLSCEPLLGPVDLSRWVTPISPMDPAAAPKTWSDWIWPEWVPSKIRAEVERFWTESFGRGPAAWLRDMHQQGTPAFGSTVTLRDGFGPNTPMTTGRFVHAWNNIGRIVREDGSVAYTSFGHDTRSLQQPLNWVVVGGETGQGAVRPMHPQWARSLRNQCIAAGVPFFFKQWGDWGPAPWRVDRDPSESVEDYKARAEAGCATHAYAVWADQYGHESYEAPHKPWSAERTTLDGTAQAPIRRWGKKTAGRRLDGRVWDEYPCRA